MSSKPPSDPTARNRAFYNQNAREYHERTKDLDMAEIYQPFLAQLAPGARILDAGCGPGRDLKAFTERGYDAVGMDASEGMVRLAREHSGRTVHHMSFRNIIWRDEFDGVWACASLLHVPHAELPTVMALLAEALKPRGVVYVSFKRGSGEREANNRHFTDLDQDGLRKLLGVVPVLAPVDVWVTRDVRTGRGEDEWLNALLRKNERYPICRGDR